MSTFRRYFRDCKETNTWISSTRRFELDPVQFSGLPIEVRIVCIHEVLLDLFYRTFKTLAH
jgi:hypothetical protein